MSSNPCCFSKFEPVLFLSPRGERSCMGQTNGSAVAVS